MGCHESQVEVWLTAARRLTNDGRRLTSTVNGLFNVYNPNRARNIGLGIGLRKRSFLAQEVVSYQCF